MIPAAIILWLAVLRLRGGGAYTGSADGGDVSTVRVSVICVVSLGRVLYVNKMRGVEARFKRQVRFAT